MAQLVDVKVGGSPMRICTASPKGKGPVPGVLVTIHGGGLDDFELDLADKLAAEGFITAAPDIFHRQPNEKDPVKRRGNLKDDELIADMDGGLAWLESTGRADMKKLAILGHCLGGRQSYLGACTRPVFRCCVVYYGGNLFKPWGHAGPSPFDKLAKLEAPVIAFYGNDDDNPSPADVDRTEAELKRLGKTCEFHRYDGAGHAFQNFLAADKYRPDATRDSWARTVTFLHRHLG